MTDIEEDQLQSIDQKMEEEMVDEVPAGTKETLDDEGSPSGDAGTDVGKNEAGESPDLINSAVDVETNNENTANDKGAILDEKVDSTPDDSKTEEKDCSLEKNTEGGEEDPEWVDILGTGQLKKKVLCEGQGVDTRPERGQLVTIRSSGQVEGGGQVDCHEEMQFVLGDGDVVQAWDLAVTLMQLGEKALVFSTQRFAYGDEGRGDDIPPNSNITYELELLKVEDKPNIQKLPVEQCCQMADKKRERGNELYSRKDYSNAINSYSKALEILGEIQASAEEQGAVDELKVKCYNNLAAAQLKVDAPNAALKSCNSVLDLQPKNVKALFRKGKVLATQFEYTEAVRIMKEALALEPANRTIHQELSKLSARQNAEKQSEKELYQRMVGDMAKVSEIPDDSKLHKRQWFYAISVGVIGVAILVGAIFASQT